MRSANHYLRCPIFRRISQFCKQFFDSPSAQEAAQRDDMQAATTDHSRTARLAQLQTARTDSGLSLTIIPRDAHPISRKQISENALKVLYRLNKSALVLI